MTVQSIKIKYKYGAYLLSPIEINNRFKQFYESLYTSNITDDSSTKETFLNGCNLTTLDQEDREFIGIKIKSNQITFIVTSPQHKCLGE